MLRYHISQLENHISKNLWAIQIGLDDGGKKENTEFGGLGEFGFGVGAYIKTQLTKFSKNQFKKNWRNFFLSPLIL